MVVQLLGLKGVTLGFGEWLLLQQNLRKADYTLVKLVNKQINSSFLELV